MAFSEIEIMECARVLEECFWSRRRPPLHLRDKMREGQRFTDQSIELFYVRPVFHHPGAFTEEPIAKVRYVRTQEVWRLYWRRANGRWENYPPYPQAVSLAEALRVIDADANACFFG